MDVEGRVKLIYDTQTFNSGFQKREFVITTKEQYPQDIKFELTKDRIDLINPYKAGDELKVHFNLRGNEFNGKYFVNLQAWRIEPLEQKSSGDTAQKDPFADAGFPEQPTGPDVTTDEEDDLPF